MKLHGLLLKSFLLLSILFAVSCSREEAKEINDFKIIEIDNPSKVEISSLADSIAYVFLKTPEGEQIANIDKLVITNEYLIAHDRDILQTIFVFDREGNFEVSLSAGLGGPGEFTSADDFDFDSETKTIWVLNNDRQRLLTYNMGGEFVKEVRLPTFVEKFKLIGEQVMLYRNNEIYQSDPYDNCQLLLLDPDKDKIVSKFLPLRRNGRYVAYYDSVEPFGRHGSHSFNQALNDTIYSFQANSLKSSYVISFGDRAYGKIAEEIRSIEEFLSSERRTQSRYTLGEIHENSSSIMGLCYAGSNYFYYLYDKQDASSVSLLGFKNDIDNMPIPYIKHLDDEIMASVLPGEYMLEYLNDTEANTRSRVEQEIYEGIVKNSGNPVIQLIHLK